MAEKNFMRFIPPNLRGPLTDLGIFGRVAADNIYGLDDDYESTGEMLGTAFREDPVGLAKDLGTGIYEGAKDIYEDPKGAFEDLKTSLGETIDRLNTPYDQLDLSTEEAQRQRAGDLMIFGEALGAGGVLTKGLVNLTKKQLREKVIQENPGLNEDQVNSIVEDRGYAPTDLIIDDGRRSPALVETDGFPMQVLPENTVPTNMEVPTVEGFEGIPIVTAAGRVIGSVLDPEEPDVDGNLYGPPDTFDEGPRRLRADERVPSYRVGDIIVSENLGEGVVTDDGMIDYNGFRVSSATPVIGVHIDEVGRDITDAILDDEPPPTTFDELGVRTC